MRLKFVFLIIVLIVISGCVQREVRTDDNNGLVINRFESDIPRIEEGDQFTLFLEIENVGGTTAENVRVNLYGASWENPVEKYISKLSPPDITTSPSIPGDFYQLEWTMDAPDLEEGVEQDFRLVGRINYNYNSNPVANIPALSKDEYRRRTLKGEALNEAIVTTNTAGPVKVSVSGASPMIVRSDLMEGEDNQYVMRITFSNVGYGIPITDNTDGKIIGHVKISGTGATMISCLGKDINGKEGDFDITLKGGYDVTKGCTVNIDKDRWNSLPEGTVTLEFSLSYEYYISRELTITSVGRIGKRITGTGSAGGTDGTTGGVTSTTTTMITGGVTSTTTTMITGGYTTPFKLQKCTDACVYNKYSADSAQCKKYLERGGGRCNHIGHKTADDTCTSEAKKKGGAGEWWCCCDGVTTTTTTLNRV